MELGARAFSICSHEIQELQQMEEKKNLFFLAESSQAGKANSEYFLLPVPLQDVVEGIWLLRRAKLRRARRC